MLVQYTRLIGVGAGPALAGPLFWPVLLGMGVPDHFLIGNIEV